MIIAAATAEMPAMNMVSLISPILRTNEFNFNDIMIITYMSKYNITAQREIIYFGLHLWKQRFTMRREEKSALNGLSLDPPVILEKIFYDTKPIIIIRLTRHWWEDQLALSMVVSISYLPSAIYKKNIYNIFTILLVLIGGFFLFSGILWANFVYIVPSCQFNFFIICWS